MRRTARIAWTIVSLLLVELVVCGVAAAPVVVSWQLVGILAPSHAMLRLALISAAIGPSYLLFALLLLFVTPVATRVLGWRTPVDAEMRIAECGWPVLAWARGIAALHVCRVVGGTLLHGTPVWTAHLRLCGARLGRRVYVNSVSLNDYNLIECGDDVVIGDGVHLSGHTVEAGIVKTGRVRIGHDVTIGLDTVIEIDVEIGSHVQVGAMSFVPKHVSLAANAVYAGVPVTRLVTDVSAAGAGNPPPGSRNAVTFPGREERRGRARRLHPLRAEDAMLQIRRILCPIDFSEASRHALAHAATIARWYGSAITALHVRSATAFVNPPIILAALPDAAIPGLTDRPQLEAQLREWLRTGAPDVETEAVVTEGSPGARIVERARALPADLIVIGSHGRVGVERLILGSVTEKVVRQASCPVMTVPPAAAATSHLPFKHLLCPIDFSRSSLAALQFAFSVAQESDARLTLLGVFEWSPDSGAKHPADTPDFRGRWEADTTRELNALVPDDVRNWCSVESAVGFGRASDQILRLAAMRQADLIVMGVQGRTALDMALFGSTANQVVRLATCPVLTLRAG